MVSQLDKALEEVVNCIVESDDYKRLIEIKKKMSTNLELMKLIDEIKLLQKKYIKTCDDNILDEIKVIDAKLNSIPIYVIYMQYLEKINDKIGYVNDEINDYFSKIINNQNSYF